MVKLFKNGLEPIKDRVDEEDTDYEHQIAYYKKSYASIYESFCSKTCL